MPKAPCKKQTETKSTSPKFRIEKYAEILKYKNPISKAIKIQKKENGEISFNPHGLRRHDNAPRTRSVPNIMQH